MMIKDGIAYREEKVAPSPKPPCVADILRHTNEVMRSLIMTEMRIINVMIGDNLPEACAKGTENLFDDVQYNADMTERALALARDIETYLCGNRFKEVER